MWRPLGLHIRSGLSFTGSSTVSFRPPAMNGASAGVGASQPPDRVAPRGSPDASEGQAPVLAVADPAPVRAANARPIDERRRRVIAPARAGPDGKARGSSCRRGPDHLPPWTRGASATSSSGRARDDFAQRPQASTGAGAARALPSVTPDALRSSARCQRNAAWRTRARLRVVLRSQTGNTWPRPWNREESSKRTASGEARVLGALAILRDARVASCSAPRAAAGSPVRPSRSSLSRISEMERDVSKVIYRGTLRISTLSLTLISRSLTFSRSRVWVSLSYL